jgi:hypothetical protein
MRAGPNLKLRGPQSVSLTPSRRRGSSTSDDPATARGQPFVNHKALAGTPALGLNSSPALTPRLQPACGPAFLARHHAAHKRR